MRVYLLFLFLFSFSVIEAQEAISTSSVYLKGGGFLQGQILEQSDTGEMTLRLRTGEVVQLNQANIAKIRTSKQREFVGPKGHVVQEKGPYTKLQIGFMGGLSSGESSYAVVGTELFSFSVGHQFNPNWQVGGGVALDFFDHNFLPMFVEGQYFLKPKNKTSFYAALQTGYALSFDVFEIFDDNFGGGAMLHPSVGVRFAGKRSTSFTLELGNRYQWGTNISPWRNTVDKVIYRRLALRAGWIF